MVKEYRLAILFVLLVVTAFKTTAQNNSLSKLYTVLPETCPTPDAFSLGADSLLWLSCPNYAEKKTPGAFLTLRNSRVVNSYHKFYLNGEQIKFRPMGIAHDDRGDLFICTTIKGSGTIFKVSPEEDKLKLELVANGLPSANGLKCFANSIYVSAPKLKIPDTKNNLSGIYRFNTTDRNLNVSETNHKEHLLFTNETKNPRRQFGLDGIAIDKKGKVYVGDFGDGTIFRLTLDDGLLSKTSVYAQLPDSVGPDGMSFGPEGKLYVAGFSQNEIWEINKKGKTRIISKNPDSTGDNGELDQPVDLIIYNGKLLISNYDLMVTEGMVNTAHEGPSTLSYIDLE